jgi:GNAT superfamily N-acetyltransferase
VEWPIEGGGRCLCVQQHLLADFVAQLESRRFPAFERLLDMYAITRQFPDFSNFRLGPNAFERTPMDWLIAMDAADASLIGHGIATRIDWDGDVASLRGWQQVVRRAYDDAMVKRRSGNTLVGLFIKVEQASREQGWAGRLVEAMKELARRAGLSSLVIPLRLPTAYERCNVELPFEQFALQRRDDGDYCDHWLRLHVRLGAQVIGHSLTSHQHAMNLDDFRHYFETDTVPTIGYCVAQRNGEWYRPYVDAERDCVVINEGCVWVQHPIDRR